MAKKKKIDKVYSAKKFGLISKKQYKFPDKFVDAMKPFQTPMMLFNLFCIQRDFKRLDVLTHLIPSLFAADFVTACVHLWGDVVDDDPYIVEDDHLILYFPSGYASCHHIFTSNFNDIDNDVLATSFLVASIVPGIVATCLGKKSIAKYCSYFSIFFTMNVFCHKFAHMRRHNIKIPPFFEFLQDYKLSLDHEVHSNHHRIHHTNYSVLNGYSDFVLNAMLKLANFDKKMDLRIENIFRYAEEFDTNEIHLRCKGDIEGDIVMYLNDGQLYTESDYKILTKK
jgi:hypothetical protein